MSFEGLGIKTRSGVRRYATTCPKCDHKRTMHKGAYCLTINDEPGNRWFKCNHCGWSGNIDSMDKYSKVAEKSGFPRQDKLYGIKTRVYLEKRGISVATAKKAKLYEGVIGPMPMLCFPYYMNMTIVNVKFLNLAYTGEPNQKKWTQLPKSLGTRIIPFGLQLITFNEDPDKATKKIVIITEGEIDMLTWMECGYKNVISVPNGAPTPNAKNFGGEFAYLEDPYVKSVFEEAQMFYLAVDDDEPGRLLAKQLAMLLGKEKCRMIKYQSGYKDINEVYAGNVKKNLTGLGKDGVDFCFQNVSALPVSGVIKPSNVAADLQLIRTRGFVAGLGCGVPEIDNLYTVKPRHIQFVTGVPGSGKSVYIRWWLVKMIQHNQDMDIKWAMFTPENRPVAREFAKISQIVSGQSFYVDDKNAMNDESYKQAMRWIEKRIFVVSPDRSNYENWDNKTKPEKLNTLDSIKKYLIYLKKTENIFGFVIDAWNKIEHEQPKYETETTFISRQLDDLLNFCDYWELHGCIIVHPKKIEMQSANYKMPSLYDIKGSSAWKEKADIGIIVHRYKMRRLSEKELVAQGKKPEELDDDEKLITIKDAPTIIRTEKIRFEELGEESRVRLKMDYLGRFVVDDKQQKHKGVNPPIPNFYETEKNEEDEIDVF